MDAAAPNAWRLLARAIQAAFEFLEIAEALYFEAEFGDEFVNDHGSFLDYARRNSAFAAKPRAQGVAPLLYRHQAFELENKCLLNLRVH